jgi:hypothetical protein
MTFRRNDTLRHTPAEKAIADAIQAVEALPADVRLTDAVMLLSWARDRVADYVDNCQSPKLYSLPQRERADQPEQKGSGT